MRVASQEAYAYMRVPLRQLASLRVCVDDYTFARAARQARQGSRSKLARTFVRGARCESRSLDVYARTAQAACKSTRTRGRVNLRAHLHRPGKDRGAS